VISQSPELQERFFDIVNSILISDQDFIDDSDRVRACQLMESMMLNLKPSIDLYIPRFLQVALGYLSDEKKIENVPFKVHALEVVINALYYNPVLTLSFLEQTQATNGFFTLWLKNLELFTRVHDKKLCILTLCSLLELKSLPTSLQSGWIHLFEGVLSVFESYGAALEERQKEEQIENGEFEDDDDETTAGSSTHLVSSKYFYFTEKNVMKLLLT
jgi:hypothetical protein